MKHINSLLVALSLLACAAACGSKPDNPVSNEKEISTDPASLRCGSEASTITFKVIAETSWEAYADDNCSSWVSSVSPAWNKENTGTVTVKVSENLARTERKGDIVIKCGATRHKVGLTQEAYVPAESEISCPIEGYTLVWHDEFEDAAVNTGNWKFENWPWKYVNNELQYYVSGGKLGNQETAYIEDGALCIKAQKANGSGKFNGSEDITGKVISARMNSRKSWKYGYMEASIWLPKGKGTWPAFWCMPDDQSKGWPHCGEIDIMEEVGVVPNEVSSSVHTKSYNHTINTQKTAKRTLPGAESGFHTYAMEWTADYIKTYVDGKLLFTFNNDGKGDDATWPFNKAFYITLNLAWGGSWGGMNGVDENALPTAMKVDYVRVFQK